MKYNHPPAVIYVDGQELIRCRPGEDYQRTFECVADSFDGEVTLMVWAPFYRGYLRRLTRSRGDPDGR